MTKTDLIEWRGRMHFSQEKASKVLGCSKSSIVRWEHGFHIPRYIGLACSAVALGLKPIGDKP